MNYHAHLEESLVLANKITTDFENSKQELDGYIATIAQLESKLAELEAALQHAKLDRNLSTTEATKQVLRLGAEISVLQARMERQRLVWLVSTRLC